MIRILFKALSGTVMFTCFWLLVSVYRETILNINNKGFIVTLTIMLFFSMLFLILTVFDKSND